VLEVSGLMKRLGGSPPFHAVIRSSKRESLPDRPQRPGKSTIFNCFPSTLAPNYGSILSGGEIEGPRRIGSLTAVSPHLPRSRGVRRLTRSRTCARGFRPGPHHRRVKAREAGDRSDVGPPTIAMQADGLRRGWPER